MSALLSLVGAAATLGGRRVVDDLTLEIAAGDIVALLGPNGAGKTTLIRAALGLMQLSAGRALLGGDDAHALSPRARALRAAYLPQRPQAIWPVSVEALVALGRYAHGAAPHRLGARNSEAVDDALEACALVSLRARRMDEISGGERARAHLARALAQRAPLLLLDEPTAGLDPVLALDMMEVLRRQAAHGGAILFSTHDIGLAARAASRVIVLCEGRVLADGEAEAALTPEVLRRAYGREGRLAHVEGASVAVFAGPVDGPD